MDIKKEVLAIIDEVLSLNGRAAAFGLDTPLLGALPELDSMAVVGLINGLVLSLVMAGIVFLWFGSTMLGAVIGAAMIFNLVAAALAGILIPLALDRLKLDPAPASGVFVTMITDCVGFFAFLGLASLILF